MEQQHTPQLSEKTFFAFTARDWFVLASVAGLVIALALVALRDETPTTVSDTPPDSVTQNAPRVAYLAPADSAAPNLYVTDLSSGEAVALTDAPHGVESYRVSPDGAQIAYTRHTDTGTSDIWLVDVGSGLARPLTACIVARCSQPVWSPDGAQIVYQRADFNAAGVRESRLWLVDVETAVSQLLLDDLQALGQMPAWSPAGDQLAWYDPRVGGIRVYDIATAAERLIPATAEFGGWFGPDGSQLLYPVAVRGAIGQSFYMHLERAQLDAEAYFSVTGTGAAIEDGSADWSPDGSSLVVARRYLDERYTSGKQLYMLDLESGEAQPVVVDAQYTHAAPQWDAEGRRIVYQRYDLLNSGALPEVWFYDTVSGRAVPVVENAFLPAWLP